MSQPTRRLSTCVKAWMVTIGNTSETIENNWKEFVSQNKRFTWVVWQVQTVPMAATRMISATLQLKERRTFKSLQSMLPFKNVLLEKCALGVPAEVRRFHCSLSAFRINGPWEHGNAPRPGTRTDLLKIVLKKGTPSPPDHNIVTPTTASLVSIPSFSHFDY